MVVEESAQYQPGFPQLLAGDFNARRESEVFASIKTAAWKEAYETIHGEAEAGYTDILPMNSTEKIIPKELQRAVSILYGIVEK